MLLANTAQALQDSFFAGEYNLHRHWIQHVGYIQRQNEAISIPETAPGLSRPCASGCCMVVIFAFIVANNELQLANRYTWNPGPTHYDT